MTYIVIRYKRRRNALEAERKRDTNIGRASKKRNTDREKKVVGDKILLEESKKYPFS